MIHVPCTQGSPEWLAARLGIPTASNFHRILTRGGSPSKQATRYMSELLAEYFIGEPASLEAFGFLERGKDMERDAREWYRFQCEADVELCGVCLRDDRLVGASPDGLVGSDGLVEFKCPSAAVQIDYLLGAFAADDYWCQCQGQLYVTDRQWVDLVAYNPALPPVVCRVERAEQYQATLRAALDTFVESMLLARRTLEARGCRPHSLKVLASQTEEEPF